MQAEILYKPKKRWLFKKIILYLPVKILMVIKINIRLKSRQGRGGSSSYEYQYTSCQEEVVKQEGIEKNNIPR